MKSALGVRRAAIALLSVLAVSTIPALAQTQRSYAVLSLIGDKIGIVTQQSTTGSSIDRNVRMDLDIPDDTFDATATRAASAAIKRENPGAVTALYSSRDPKLYALQEKLVDSDTQAAALADSLRDLLAQAKVTHLLLITKFRSDARLRLVDGNVGNGKLTGIGFYVDLSFATMDVESGRSSRGFFAPYAYLKLTLIDAITLKPLGVWTTIESHVYGTHTSDTANVPWDVLTAGQKVAALRAVINDAVEDAVPRVINLP